MGMAPNEKQEHSVLGDQKTEKRCEDLALRKVLGAVHAAVKQLHGLWYDLVKCSLKVCVLLKACSLSCHYWEAVEHLGSGT